MARIRKTKNNKNIEEKIEQKITKETKKKKEKRRNGAIHRTLLDFDLGILNMNEPFSARHGYDTPSDGALIYEDAPESLRTLIINIVTQDMQKSSSFLRSAICSVLLCREDPSNYGEPYIDNEAKDLIYSAPWYNIYDLIEKLPSYLKRYHNHGDVIFAEHINQGFVRLNIGWQLKNGIVQLRGDDGFEATFHKAVDTLEEKGFERAKNEIKEALNDLAKRPIPDTHGSVRHSIGALESVAREIEYKHKKTLGGILRENRELFPAPLGDALGQIWGFCSDNARHVREDREVERPEAMLILGLSSSLITYLIDKNM